MSRKIPRFVEDRDGVVHALIDPGTADHVEQWAELHSEFVVLACETDESGDFLGEDECGESLPVAPLTPTRRRPTCLGCWVREGAWRT